MTYSKKDAVQLSIKGMPEALSFELTEYVRGEVFAPIGRISRGSNEEGEYYIGFFIPVHAEKIEGWLAHRSVQQVREIEIA